MRAPAQFFTYRPTAMLYLFGRLALGDSLAYHADFYEPAHSRNRERHPAQTRPDTRAAAISRRLRRSRHFPQSARAAWCYGS